MNTKLRTKGLRTLTSFTPGSISREKIFATLQAKHINYLETKKSKTLNSHLLLQGGAELPNARFIRATSSSPSVARNE